MTEIIVGTVLAFAGQGGLTVLLYRRAMRRAGGSHG